MNTLNNTKIILNTAYGFLLLAILALGAFSAPAEVNAEAYGGYILLSGEKSNNNQYYSNNQSYNNGYQNSAYYPQNSGPTPTVYSGTASPNTTGIASAPKTVAKAKTATVTDTADANEPAPDSSLVANALFGENFAPASITGWMLIAVSILGITLLVRKIYSADKKYLETPMKHK